MLPNLIPQPQKCDVGEGELFLGGFRICLAQCCEDRLFRAAQKLRAELEAETGETHVLTKAPEAGDLRWR